MQATNSANVLFITEAYTPLSLRWFSLLSDRSPAHPPISETFFKGKIQWTLTWSTRTSEGAQKMYYINQNETQETLVP
jgi:hypothetical protein